LFKKEKPHIVHSITPKAGLLSMTAAYFAGVPVRMHTFTGLIFPYRTGFMKQLLLFMDKLLCRMATHIYPEGEGVKQDLIAYKVTNKPLNVLANGNVNGIDLSYFNPERVNKDQKELLKATLQIKTCDFVFVYVGRLVGDKGINELVTAFNHLVQENKNCKLLLVGPFENDLDPLNSNIMTIIESNKKIIAVGFQEDIRLYLSISDVFVFPSYREGFPNVVLQAGAMELPCIVTDISGSNEIITEGYNGLVVPAKNSVMLLGKMKLLLENSNLKTALKNNARKNVVVKYEQSTVWNALLAEYKKLEFDV
jgi:glycosyltransferase involved in cell wall biosynthesis